MDTGMQKIKRRTGKLVETDDGTTDLFGSALGLVHGHQARDYADTETRDNTTDDENDPAGVELKANTEEEDDATEDDTVFAAKTIADGVSSESAEESTSREN